MRWLCAIIRELSKYRNVSVPLLESADGVSQGAPQREIRASYIPDTTTNLIQIGPNIVGGGIRCSIRWMNDYASGYQKNGSLVLAFNESEMKVLVRIPDVTNISPEER